MDDLTTAKPSADLEKGVRPDPLSCSSYVKPESLGCGVTTSRKNMLFIPLSSHT